MGYLVAAHPHHDAPWLNYEYNLRFFMVANHSHLSQGASHSFDPEEQLDQIALAKACIDKGEFANAELIYRELIKRGTKEVKVYSNLAVICGLDGRLAERLRWLESAILLDEQLPEAWMNLGVAYHEVGRLDEASASYERAIQLNKNLVEVFYNLSRLKFIQGANEEALHAIEMGLALRPDHELLLMNYGIAMHLLGRADEAILHYLEVVALYPDNARLIFLIGRALDAIGQVDQAIELYSQAISLDATDAAMHYHLGITHLAKGELDSAMENFRRSVELDPSSAEPAVNLAMGYFRQGELQRSIDCLKSVLRLHPRHLNTHQNLQFVYSVAGVEYVHEAAHAARDYWEIVRSEPAPLLVADPAFLTDVGEKKIRIGILCAEISGHCVSQFIESFLRHYDRDSFLIELIAPATHYQQRSEELAQLADSIVALQGLTSVEARNRVMARNYDIILETSGFTGNTAMNLLAERCAPIQCHYIGYHASTRLDTIDYFIGDFETTPPEFAWQFSETLWQLQRPWLACTPFGPLPTAEPRAKRISPVLGSFNQLAKVRRETLAFWAEALLALPDSVLLIKDRLTASALVRQRIEDSLAQCGVDPERLLYLPLTSSWEEHMDCYNLIDIALDTTPWSSATTGFDALGMGVPLVAIRGSTTSARMSSTLVKALGHSEWVAESPEQFAEIVKQLGSDFLFQRHNKARFQNEVLNSLLYDAADLTSHLERAFRLMLIQNANE
ncbi:tetratricopeptide repeat protein [Cyanobium sp. ULC084]